MHHESIFVTVILVKNGCLSCTRHEKKKTSLFSNEVITVIGHRAMHNNQICFWKPEKRYTKFETLDSYHPIDRWQLIFGQAETSELLLARGIISCFWHSYFWLPFFRHYNAALWGGLLLCNVMPNYSCNFRTNFRRHGNETGSVVGFKKIQTKWQTPLLLFLGCCTLGHLF